jgi:tetratricopeptide (TPR) repeat protein
VTWRRVLSSPDSPEFARAVSALLGALAAAPYLITLGYGFVLDDISVIVGNSALHAPNGFVTAWSAPFVPNALFGAIGLYRPVSGSLFALLWLIGGGQPWLFHLVVIAAHATATILVFRLLARAVPGWWAAAAAAVFAVQPLHVEAVANIVGSSEVLVAIGALAYVLIILRAAQRDNGTLGTRTALLAAAAYGFAIFAKESGAMVPAIGLAVWWGWRAPSGESVPTLAALIKRGWRVWLASAVVFFGFIVARASVIGGGAIPHGQGGPPWTARVLAAMGSWPTVAMLLTMPGHLRMHYREPDPAADAILPALVGLALAMAIAAGAVYVFARRSDRRPLAALAWIALAFLPASNLLVATGQLVGERNLYGASVGAEMVTAWALAALAMAKRERIAAFIAGAFILFGFVRSAEGALAWKSNPDLWAYSIEADPLDYKPQWSLAIWFLQRGDLRHGAPLLERAHELNPTEPQLASDYAQILQARGQMDSSLVVLRAATLAAPRKKGVRDVYLTSLIRAGHADSALADLRTRALDDPLGASRYRLIAQAYDARGARDTALVYYRMAIDSAADAYDLRLIEAVVLERAGRGAEGQKVRAAMIDYRSPTPAEVAAMRARIHGELEQR